MHVDKQLFLDIVERLAVLQEAARVMTESRWNELPWEELHDKAEPVLNAALARVVKAGRMERMLGAFFVTFGPGERRKFIDESGEEQKIRFTVKYEVTPKPIVKDGRTTGDCDSINFKRFSGPNSDYARLTWHSFTEPREAISLIDHCLSKGPEIEEIEKLVGFAKKQSVRNLK